MDATIARVDARTDARVTGLASGPVDGWGGESSACSRRARRDRFMLVFGLSTTALPRDSGACMLSSTETQSPVL